MIIQFQVIQRVEGLCIYALDSGGKMYWGGIPRDGRVEWRPMPDLPEEP
jgi:hypothetical protein